MKIAFVTSESFIDHSYTIVNELRKSIEVKTYLQAKNRTEEISRWCDMLNAEFVERKRFRNPFSFLREYNFFKELKRSKFELIWFNTMTFFQIFWAKLLLKNFLVTIHDIEWHPESSDYIGLMAQKLNLFLIRKRICVVSKTQSDIFKKHFGFEPVLMQLPVIDYYSAVKKETGTEPKENDTIRFFYFGTIEKYKGIETLISAAEILEKENARYKLNIYGKLKYNREMISERISRIKNICLKDEFVNYTDVHSLYCENDVLVLPYYQVTQCGPLLIAYNEIIPVICSDLPGFREYVDDDRSGMIFDNTPGDLANKMLFLINNPQFVKKIREYIVTEIKARYSMTNLKQTYISNLKLNIGK